MSEISDFDFSNILYKMFAFFAENPEGERGLYFVNELKGQFEKSDGLDVKTMAEFKAFDILMGYYEKEETV